MQTTLLLVILFAGALIGAVAGWLIAKSRFDKTLPFSDEEFRALQRDKSLLEQRVSDLRLELEEKKKEAFAGSEKIMLMNSEQARLSSMNDYLQEKLQTHKQELEQLQKQIKEQFENIASKILHDNSRIIQQQHSDKLNDLLNPLKEKIEKFEGTVNTTHKESIRENQTLKEQIKYLADINKTIGEEARNLTTALKGQVKTQGNWGEFILETILEKSGLVKDREYFVQTSMTSEEGRRLQPDVLIRLPENKSIVIDSKVSLNAYEKFCNAATEEEREVAIKEHINSLRRHLKGLGEKKYQQLYEINSLDFVLMFIPVEPAFSVAIQKEPGLFNEAFDNNIVMVSASTLLATLRTIASIWKLEYQNKNALEIARQSGALYDKFVGFLKDMDSIGSNLDSAHKAWDLAINKLSTGRGNLVSAADKIKKLGANASKTIPENYLNDQVEDMPDKLLPE